MSDKPASLVSLLTYLFR